ncbi:GntR family transcriptional regulator [Streptomyces katrae]|uniref:GntR family transcriptional regulator n=1 Tax=Streptomyces katrae TaxID=68223 RepID=UPI0004C1F36B|nr:GntR family transcriptional regulator [Streptomyces katrae]
MSEQVSPRGTFLRVADALKAQIVSTPEMAELPSLPQVMDAYGVSRGVALRAFQVLQKEGVAEPVPGARWRVVREGQSTDRRPLAERVAALIVSERLEVGAAFLSAGELSSRLGASRPTISKALTQLEAAGVLSEGGQGKRRTVRAVPNQEEDSKT